MNPLSVSLAVFVAALLIYAAARAYRRSKRGSACCGEREASPRRVKTAHRRRADYPYVYEAEIGGMTCENCAVRAENALNALDGVWASVRKDKNRALIRTKQPADEAALRRAVHQAGYSAGELKRR